MVVGNLSNLPTPNKDLAPEQTYRNRRLDSVMNRLSAKKYVSAKSSCFGLRAKVSVLKFEMKADLVGEAI